MQMRACDSTENALQKPAGWDSREGRSADIKCRQHTHDQFSDSLGTKKAAEKTKPVWCLV